MATAYGDGSRQARTCGRAGKTRTAARPSGRTGRRLLSALLGAALLLTAAGCTRYQGEPGDSEKPGVSMRTQELTYPTGVEEIRVLWKNDSPVTLTFGESWTLEKQEGDQWVEVSDRETEIAFFSIGYEVRSRGVREHTYGVRTYADSLEEGRYRIVTSCSQGSGDSLQNYTLTAEFEVMDIAVPVS